MSDVHSSHYLPLLQKPGHKVGVYKIKLEREFEMEMSGRFNNERKKKWCNYYHSKGHSDKKCFQQLKESGKSKNGVQKK